LRLEGETGAKVEARLMTVRQAAEYLSVPVPTLYTRVWQRSIPFVRLGRSIRFDRKDLDQLIEANKVQPLEDTIGADFQGRHDR